MASSPASPDAHDNRADGKPQGLARAHLVRTAMQDATERVSKVSAFEPDRAFAAIGEALRWTTIVDDDLRRHHPEAYTAATQPFEGRRPPYPADILLGLRSVRNRLGHEVELCDIIRTIASRVDPGDGRITAWQWQHIPPPSGDGRSVGQRDYDLREPKPAEIT